VTTGGAPDLRLVLDRTALQAYATAIGQVATTLREVVIDEGGYYGVPVTALIETIVGSSAAGVGRLRQLTAQPSCQVLPVLSEHAWLLADWMRRLGGNARLDRAVCAMAATWSVNGYVLTSEPHAYEMRHGPAVIAFSPRWEQE
jgi:hypothetical protein